MEEISGNNERVAVLRSGSSNPSINRSMHSSVDMRTRSTSAAVKGTDEENVRVIIRIRPLSNNEKDNGCRDVTVVDEIGNVLSIFNPDNPTGLPKTFRFDGIFSTDSTQAELFNQVARPIIYNVIQGYNGTIFAYGQTGTGKTFTMEGDRSVPELKGIIPNSFAQIFSHISKESEDSRFLVRVSYLEIYNEDVRDLLGKDASKRLEVKERPDTGVYVKNLSSFVVRNENDMERILGIGNRNRVVGTTNMNAQSSRSHAIFSINIECSTEKEGDRSLRMGKLNLVDLAGSERVSKTGATGHRLKEGAKINLSLSCLGNVISALVDGQAHVPYRSSKLTRLLQDSLGGNSKTVMIANVGPADYNYDETVSTLRYADRAKQIKNHAHVNEDPKDALLRQFEQEIEELRRQLEENGFVVSESGMESDRTINDKDDELRAGEVSSFLIPDEDTLIGIKGEIESQEKLSSRVKTEAENKKSTLDALKQNVLNWKHKQEKKTSLEEKLKSIQKKIMVGGENLLDKSQEQEAFLQTAMKELQERRKEQLKLQTSLTTKIAEKVVYEEQILKLQAESREIKKQLRKVYQTLQKEELEDEAAIEDEEAEKDAIAIEIDKLCQHMKVIKMIVSEYIPEDILKSIQERMTYNEEAKSWDIPSIAYAGNHVEQATFYHTQQRNHTKQKNIGFFYKSIGDIDKTGLKALDENSMKNLLNSTPIRVTSVLSHDERNDILDKYIASEAATNNIKPLENSEEEAELVFL